MDVIVPGVIPKHGSASITKNKKSLEMRLCLETWPCHVNFLLFVPYTTGCWGLIHIIDDQMLLLY